LREVERLQPSCSFDRLLYSIISLLTLSRVHKRTMIQNWFGRNLDRREPKWDLRVESRQGKCNWALREPRRRPLVTKIVSQCMLRLTDHYSTTAYPLPTLASPLSHPRVTLAHSALQIKQPCSPFQTETDFVQIRVQVNQPAVIICNPDSLPNLLFECNNSSKSHFTSFACVTPQQHGFRNPSDST
jgi:hypothetical protein